MLVGYNGYCYRGKHAKSKVFLIKYPYNINKKKGYINVGYIHFPPECIGKRVRIKVEFVEE